ncbi:YfbM family protein [Rariglobus hedericola]|uniref:DUF1877 family protein n=1 Tax=Rariglobus hedericola TaxID=2597822 RepID=A0A556QDL5_9BACT|nr:YfbM family protein [Rariglobus hedericola]TSJ74696.1 DUF1877 family protein [Rariglobus hedericola]
MSCLGVHFALTAEEVKTLKSFTDDSERLEYLQEEIEETYMDENADFCAQTDKAWDAMHRLLADGELSYYDGPEPLRFTVIGGEPIYAEGDYIMSLKTLDQVKALATALPKITKEEFRKKYDSMDEGKYGCQKSDEDFEYTWDWFTGVVTLYQKAASAGRFVLFTADQ